MPTAIKGLHIPLPIPELLLPGGSFSSAIAAFNAGADGVYLGLKSFSARKGANNFSWEDLDRLRGFVHSPGDNSRKKKIYVAMNTLVTDQELEDFITTVDLLVQRKIDGLILQDPGLVWALRSHYPDLPLHGSTQMGIHNAHGLEQAQRLGLQRVVLSRELSFQEIQVLRQDFPEMELEIFIQGALCYGFSGLCLASGTLTDRSANRGECAQICRTWFEGKGGKSFDFSTNDLSLGQKVRQLADVGIDSLKIEGRMKGPEYTAAAARWYRGILEGKSEPELRSDERDLRLAFSRHPTSGFWTGAKGSKLLGTDYPGSRGLRAGKVKTLGKKEFFMDLETDLALRDGLGFWMEPGKETLFGVQNLRDEEGKKLTAARPGQGVWISCGILPQVGQEIRKLSAHDGNLPGVNPLAHPPRGIGLDIKAVLEPGKLVLTWEGGEEVYPVEWQEARTGIFSASFYKAFEMGEGLFTLETLKMENRTTWTEVFLSPKELKSIRRNFYQKVETLWPEIRNKRVQRILEALSCAKTALTWPIPPAQSETFTPWPLSENSELPQWIFLPALEFTKEGRSSLEKALDRRNIDPNHPSETIYMGINNLSHLDLVIKSRDRGWKNLKFFADYGLYAANRTLGLWLKAQFPEVEALTPWVERPEVLEYPGLPTLSWAPGRPLPLFYSRICWRLHSLGKTCAWCPGHYEAEVSQGKNVFRVMGRDCMTLVVKK